MEPQKFSVGRQAKSFRDAFAGMRKFIVHERNARIHLLATCLVLILSLLLGVSRSEAIELVIAIGIVWTAEMFNTALEKLVDFITVEQYPLLGFVKDVSGAAVLVAAVTAMVIGSLVFIPKIL